MNNGHINLFDDFNFNEDKLLANDFFKAYVDDDTYLFFYNLYHCHISDAIEYLDKMIYKMNRKNDIMFDHYQKASINNNGAIALYGHTLEKFNSFLKLHYYLPEKFTVVDHGCNIGSIGGKIAQIYKNAFVTFININESEVDTLKFFFNDACISNYCLIKRNLMTIRNKYDVTLFFAILHHILKTHTISEVVDYVYETTNLFSIIEVPCGDDALLAMVKKHGALDYNDTFAYLENIDKFKDAFSNKFVVLDCYKIDYQSHDLNRYILVLKKIQME
jgi:hypothetical protein